MSLVEFDLRVWDLNIGRMEFLHHGKLLIECYFEIQLKVKRCSKCNKVSKTDFIWISLNQKYLDTRVQIERCVYQVLGVY